jgi:hypothetical protein
MNSEIWHGPGRTVTYGVGGDRRRRWSIQISAVPFVLIQISEGKLRTLPYRHGLGPRNIRGSFGLAMRHGEVIVSCEKDEQ